MVLEIFRVVKLPIQFCMALALAVVGTTLFHFVVSAMLFVATILEIYQREDERDEF
jgi:hypothetical protein